MSENLNNSNLPDYEQYDYVDELDFRVGFGKRFAAWLIDVVIYSAALLIVLSITGIFGVYLEQFSSIIGAGMEGGIADPNTIAEMEAIGYEITMYSTVLGILYYSLEVIYGASLGKMMLGLRIANSNRTWASINTLIVRASLKNISMVVNVLFLVTSMTLVSTFGSIFGVIAFIGCFVVLSEKKQALHDLIAKTAVYYKAEIMTDEEAQKVRNI